MRKYFALIAIISFLSLPFMAFSQEDEVDATVRKEREHIRKGNKLYEAQRYADAEIEYMKALEANPNSMIGNYNLALTLINQSGGNNSQVQDSVMLQASRLLSSVAMNSRSADLRSKAFYNLGNIAYNGQQYDQSIEMYKNALRINPDDDQARENLRLAQLQKKDGGNDKNKDKKEEQDKNEDKKEDKKEDRNQPKQQHQQPNPQQMSKENMEQILQAMQNQEKETQAKVNEQKPKTVKKTGNQW